MLEEIEKELEKIKEEIAGEERRKIIKEIILAVGRIKLRLKKTVPPLPIPDGKAVFEKEIPKLKELLEKVV